MNILLLGSGGRENALAWKITQSEKCDKLFIAPGNAGTANVGTNVAIKADDFDAVKEFVLTNDIKMVVVGPEDPLVKGVYDYFKNTPELANIPVIGPSKEGARLEGSKAFAKAFMMRQNIPTAAYKEFTAKEYDEAVEFFSQEDSSLNKRIVEKLSTLQRVGLGYVKLGQSSSTLSGGESQRVKLAAFLQKESYSQPILFIFDEPTTGLHFHDIKKLLDSFNALISNGHTIVIVEHNPEVIKCADWIIDLGPDGGEQGGNLMFEGTPNDLKNSDLGYTYKYI